MLRDWPKEPKALCMALADWRNGFARAICWLPLERVDLRWQLCRGDLPSLRESHFAIAGESEGD